MKVGDLISLHEDDTFRTNYKFGKILEITQTKVKVNHGPYISYWPIHLVSALS